MTSADPHVATPFEAVLRARLSRRTALAGGMAVAASSFLASPPLGALGDEVPTPAPRHGGGHPRISFTALRPDQAVGPEPAIAPEYTMQPLIPWGTPLDPDGPPFTWPAASPADQGRQVGIGHDGMAFFADPGRNDKGVLCINHEVASNRHVLGRSEPESLDDVKVMQHALGVSCVVIQRIDGVWRRVADRRNRRIHVRTPVDFSGPAAGTPFIDSGRPVARGTVGNCANGRTPWGTYLTCEENFQACFGTDDHAYQPPPLKETYGLRAGSSRYHWHRFDPRFDLASPGAHREVNRFGWVVEIDPQRPWSRPVKRTAMGRFRHEGVAVTVGRGNRIVGYMGDDSQFQFIYRYVSNGDYEAMLARGVSPLDRGRLYAARFDEDGTGRWLLLSRRNPAIRAAFGSRAKMLVHTREAARLAGATPMDRPEWTAVHPSGDVYVTLTNNVDRAEPDAANPSAPNPNGHIVRLRDRLGHTGRSFEWDVFLVADDVADTPDAFGSPDGLWVDPDGRIFIQTDGHQPGQLNNQMLVADQTGRIKRLFAGVPGCEVTGITTTPDRRTMFVNVQHPGGGNATITNFPAPTDGTTVPRDATVAISRIDGGVVGS